MLMNIKALRGEDIFSIKLAIATISDQSLGTPVHFCNICHTNLSLSPLPPNSMLFVVKKSSLPVFNFVGGKEFPYFNDVIRHWPQNTLSTHFRAVLASCAKDLKSSFVVFSSSLKKA